MVVIIGTSLGLFVWLSSFPSQSSQVSLFYWSFSLVLSASPRLSHWQWPPHSQRHKNEPRVPSVVSWLQSMLRRWFDGRQQKPHHFDTRGEGNKQWYGICCLPRSSWCWWELFKDLIGTPHLIPPPGTWCSPRTSLPLPYQPAIPMHRTLDNMIERVEIAK